MPAGKEKNHFKHKQQARNVIHIPGLLFSVQGYSPAYLILTSTLIFPVP